MSNPRKQAGRPKKQGREPADSRAPDVDSEGYTPQSEWVAMASRYRQQVINRLRVAPKGDCGLSGILAPVILGQASAWEKRTAGEVFCAILESATPERLEVFLHEVAALKLNTELTHRNAYGYYGYCRYIEETGKEPTKAQLRKYIMARPSEFKDQPAAEDKKAWSRLWKDTGLFFLSDR